MLLDIKKFEILCDNQLTSNVIVTKEFLLNIHPCRWTICLCTHTSMCKINQIGDLPGVGTACYYPDGVANILLYHNPIIDSKLSIDKSSHKFEKFSDMRDLSIDFITSERVEFRFFLTVPGQHIMDCFTYFKEGEHPYVFGKKDYQ